MPVKVSFSAEAFYAALDSVRQTRNLNWKDVAKQSGVGASTLTRMAQGKRPDADGLTALLAWSNLDIENYMSPSDRTYVKESAPLAMISTLLRSDKNLNDEASTALDQIIKVTYETLRNDKE